MRVVADKMEKVERIINYEIINRKWWESLVDNLKIKLQKKKEISKRKKKMLKLKNWITKKKV